MYIFSSQTQQPKTYSSSVSYSTNIAISHFSSEEIPGQIVAAAQLQLRQISAGSCRNPFKPVSESAFLGEIRAAACVGGGRVHERSGNCKITLLGARRKYRGKYQYLLAEDDSNLSRFGWSNARGRWRGRDCAQLCGRRRRQHSK